MSPCMLVRPIVHDEVRRIAEAPGARDVPASEQAVTDYVKRIQPELAFTERSREMRRRLSQVKLPVPAAGLSRDLFLLAGTAQLPDWASQQSWACTRCGRSHRCFARH